jgi:Phage portal protein, SPP1 Gp6-like
MEQQQFITNRNNPGTVEWWRDRLLDQLLWNQQSADEWYAYYFGSYSPPPVHAGDAAAAYKTLLDESKHAWGRLLIAAVAERLDIVGVRLGPDQRETDDALAWRIFQDNRMDASQRMVHTDTLVTGASYVSVWPTPEGLARVRAESSSEAVTEQDPENMMTPIAGLKAWFDDVTTQYRAILWLPDKVYRWNSAPRQPVDNAPASMRTDLPTIQWKAESSAPNPLLAIPLIPFINDPDVWGWGHSEIQPVESILRRIDRLSLNLLLAAETAAFRQKWATGLVVPKDPETGQPISPFNVALDKLWVSTSEKTSFGTFDATTLDGYIKALSEAVAQLAAISRVPAHYLLSQSLVNPPSAESLDASEAGLVAKVRDRQSWYGESWEQVMALALSIEAPELQPEVLGGVEMVWRDPQRRSEAAMADASLKWRQMGIPEEAVWEHLGATPTQIIRWRQMRLREMFLQELAAPEPTTQPQPAPPEEEEAVPSGGTTT